MAIRRRESACAHFTDRLPPLINRPHGFVVEKARLRLLCGLRAQNSQNRKVAASRALAPGAEFDGLVAKAWGGAIRNGWFRLGRLAHRRLGALRHYLADRLIEDGDAALDLLARHGERRRDAPYRGHRPHGNDVHGESQLHAACSDGAPGGGVRRAGLAVLDQLDALQQPEAADVADDLMLVLE